jgi:prepilin peptidase CpaA
MPYRLLMLVPMVMLLIVAAAQDMRHRKIRNWLTLSLVLGGITQSMTASHTVEPMQSLMGIAVGFTLTFVLFALGALGGGDVKLMAGVGAWVGPVVALQVFMLASIAGMIIVLVQCAWNGRLRMLFRNSALLAVNLVHTADLGVHHVSETGKSCRSVDRPLPYAVPVLIAVVFAITMTLYGG